MQAFKIFTLPRQAHQRPEAKLLTSFGRRHCAYIPFSAVVNTYYYY